MNARDVKILVGTLGIMTLVACASTTPHTDSRFGHAVSTARLQQTLNPDAGSGAQPPVGLGGTPARETIERYHDSFKAPTPTFEVLFGTGTSGR